MATYIPMLGGYNNTFVKQFLDFSFYNQWVTDVECFPFQAQVLCGLCGKFNILTLNTIKDFWVRSYFLSFVKETYQLATLEALHLIGKIMFHMGLKQQKIIYL